MKRAYMYEICSKGSLLGRFIFSIMNFGSDGSGLIWHHIYMPKKGDYPKMMGKRWSWEASKPPHMTTYDHHFSIYGKKRVMGSQQTCSLHDCP